MFFPPCFGPFLTTFVALVSPPAGDRHAQVQVPPGPPAAGGFFPAEVDFLNSEIAALLDVVSGGGARRR
jgi:hypothetical protein